ncbi:MAG: hypothetical protein ASARMPRED_000454 [Alectoria sarmentosa]|nr:MAG: hypothetical protein ASARMPRED_000454 [Alectoria sarmentosa]
MSIPSSPPAGDIGPATCCFKLETKVSFKVAYDLRRGYEAQPIRVTIPKDESYDQFLWRLHNVFYGDSFERSLRQWEYVLVNRRFEKGDSLPLTSSNTYYAMVSELLRQRSQWRHAVIRRSHSENPIIRAVAEGRYTPTLDLPILDAAVPDISLFDNTPVSDASQLDDSKADNPRPNVPMDQATPELLNSTPPSRAWNVNSASTTPLSRKPSPAFTSRPNTRELSTPVASTQSRRLLQLSSPLAPSARVRDPMQPYSPLISSPLAPTTSKGGRRSMQLSFPIAPVTASPRSSQVNPPLAPVISTQGPILLDSPPLAPAALLGSPSLQLGSPIRPPASAQAPPMILPIVSGPSSSQDHGSNEGLGELSSPAVIAPRTPAVPPITSISSSSTPAPELFQRPMRLNLAACRDKFVQGNWPNYTYIHTNYTYTHPNYTWNGPIRGIYKNLKPPVALITLQACRDICGEGPDYYTWAQLSNTITTWVLPVIGLILQAPFESNKNLNSFFALARWIGNPIASISYVLWNIKVTGKCGMMVDMATPYHEFPGEDSQFAHMRDSLYILSVMNQCKYDLIEEDETMIAAEKLLRIALFSDELPMTPEASLTDRRKKLAGTIRAFRKKGVIPVFVSTLWFLLALAISIQSAFGDIGDEVTTNLDAHDLALGLLLSFLPIFILSCVVDRNAVAAGRICVKLNRLLASVRRALLDDELRRTYGEQIRASPEFFNWISILGDEKFDDFFTDFAGQGRIRWHYGVAHPLLCSFEDSFMAEHGRGWLPEDNANRARTFMRDHRDEDHRLIWFDPRMIRQIASSICVVCASAGGAFILSYNTPTVGLGCRSGGYMIYVVIAMFLFLVEMLCWGLRTSYLKHQLRLRRISDHMPRNPIFKLLHHFERTIKLANTGKFTKAGRTQVENILGVIEVGNVIWLAYIVTAQTVGSYETCDCGSSVWAPGGGYFDFQGGPFYREHGIFLYWGAGTGLSGAVLVVGLAYIVAEFCTQSHLATEDFRDASEGVKVTRWFKKYTYWLRLLLSLCDEILFLIWKVVRFPWQRATGRQPTAFNKTLIWDWKVKPSRADGTPNQAHNDRSRRPSSTHPLMAGLRDDGSSRNSRSLERSEEGEGPENQTHDDNERRGSRHASPFRARMPTLQLPTQSHSRDAHSRSPSISSEASLSSGPRSHLGD